MGRSEMTEQSFLVLIQELHRINSVWKFQLQTFIV